MQGNPGSTLIIIDNVGELNIEFKESDFADTLDEEMPLSVMLEKLIIGKLLKGATVIGSDQAIIQRLYRVGRCRESSRNRGISSAVSRRIYQ